MTKQVTGQVVPVDWNDDDQVTQVAIVDDNGDDSSEDEYFVVENNELLEYVDEVVEAHGEVIEEYEDGGYEFKVAWFRVVDDDAEPSSGEASGEEIEDEYGDVD